MEIAAAAEVHYTIHQTFPAIGCCTTTGIFKDTSKMACKTSADKNTANVTLKTFTFV